jgi:phosphoglycolate phosphatase-like HAD superfamily hydrolase
MVRTVIFDFDDTLIVSRADRAKTLLLALETFGTPASEEQVDSFWGRSFREMVCGLAPTVANDYDRFIAHYCNILEANPPTARPGVPEVLLQLSFDHLIFVHSASNSRLIRTDLQSLKVLQLIDFVCGSDWQRVGKPDPGSFESLVQLLSTRGILDDDEIWYVGDSESDAIIAQRASFHFVGIAYDADRQAQFARLGVREDRITDSLVSLPRILSAV